MPSSSGLLAIYVDIMAMVANPSLIQPRGQTQFAGTGPAHRPQYLIKAIADRGALAESLEVALWKVKGACLSGGRNFP